MIQEDVMMPPMDKQHFGAFTLWDQGKTTCPLFFQDLPYI